MGRIKKSFCREFFLKCFKSCVQISHPVQHHCGTIKLISTVAGIYGDLANGNYLCAVIRSEFQSYCGRAEHNAL